jgi:hypothetical protein
LNIQVDRDSARNKAQRFLETYYDAKFPSIEKMALCGTIGDTIARLEEYAPIGLETAALRFSSFKDQITEIEFFREQIASRF